MKNGILTEKITLFMLKDKNSLHKDLVSNLRHQRHMIPFVCSQAFKILKASKLQLLQPEQKAYAESFIYKSTEIKTNVDRIVWVLFDAFGAEVLVSGGGSLICFCYMLLTYTVTFHSEKFFSIPETSWGGESYKINCYCGPFACSIQNKTATFLD